MLNVTALTEKIAGNRGYVEDILTAIGYRPEELRYHPKGYYQFRRLEGDNPTAIQFWVDTLAYVCYTRAEKGDLYTLVMQAKGISFPAALHFIANTISYWPEGRTAVKLPFGGYYRGLLHSVQYPEFDLAVYDESILDDYEGLSYMWNQEGISYRTQEVFGIGMDLESNSILIPERSITGDLIGIQARRNERNCPHSERWWAFLPCSRQLTLFGYAMNYREIVERQSVFIVESEKSVMKGYEMGVRNVVAICGSKISETQARLLKALRLKKYVLALDDGLSPEHYEVEAKKLLIHNPLYCNAVYYIRDDKHLYLTPGEKESPFDKPFTTLKQLTRTCLVPVQNGGKHDA